MRLKQEVKKRDDVIDSLKNDIDCHKKEIQERDDTIQDKVSIHCASSHSNILRLNYSLCNSISFPKLWALYAQSKICVCLICVA